MIVNDSVHSRSNELLNIKKPSSYSVLETIISDCMEQNFLLILPFSRTTFLEIPKVGLPNRCWCAQNLSRVSPFCFSISPRFPIVLECRVQDQAFLRHPTSLSSVKPRKLFTESQIVIKSFNCTGWVFRLGMLPVGLIENNVSLSTKIVLWKAKLSTPICLIESTLVMKSSFKFLE